MIVDNLTRILTTIATAARRSGRHPDTVQLVAVSKQVGVEAICEAVAGGQMLFGENYLQEAADKIPQLPPTVQWHFIGHLQSNKAAQVAELFTMVETVDRFKVAKALDLHAKRLDKHLSILIQVNIGREKQKSGVMPEETTELLHAISAETNLRVRGLMALPPFFSDPEKSRPYFRALRELAQQLAVKKLFHDNDAIELSMGMSNDYPVAIEEGATIVRVGTALFGSRMKEGVEKK
ncbi:alanine racemase domain protein [Desulfobulbus propionicus DSM 2032]|uniref:Pyridoxal phosphate homeostasis protein n=1 Tax=Desulfobulbus propionicus (strain ATCC 33891 / DSM 2032 / VKM B-1956 / 1pr3) TaxID=577650 RepID=A0A7U3YN75_DESPD|nr:YggS family pyridoxal phosphate-dependent enzyme [Desulfobulbus propionicus]ADW18338.1 alanine racemase domain protein [Desulfobulbus propionicus DSM 2032]